MPIEMVPVRDPSIEARLHTMVSVTRIFDPIIDFAKSGKPSVGSTRLVTISVWSPFGVTDSVWDRAWVASHFSAWNLGSAIIANTVSGAAAYSYDVVILMASP